MGHKQRRVGGGPDWAVGAAAVIVMIITAYNPLAAAEVERVAHIAQVLRHSAIVGLSGTQRRQYGEETYSCRSVQTHRALEWGWRPKSQFTNKAAGVTLLLSKRWVRQKSIKRILSPPPPLAGRLGGAVIKTTFHMLVIVAYFPYTPSSSRGKITWRNCWNAMINWIEERYRGLKGACYMVYMIKVEYVKMKEQLQAYNTKAQELGKGHGLGPPAVSTEEAHDLVPHCRLRKAFDETLHKPELMISNSEVRELLRLSLPQTGAKRLLGQAPEGRWEDLISRALAAMELS
jgi:hypothetical protein